MGGQVITYNGDKLARGETIGTRLLYKITGAKTVEDHAANAALTFFDTGVTQAQVDAFLGTTNEILIAGFGSTSMGTGSFGGVIDMGGQCASCEMIKAVSYDGTTAATVVQTICLGSTTALPNTLTSDAQVGASGNIGFHAIITGVDAITSGWIEVTIYWRAK